MTEKRVFALFLSFGGSLQKWRNEGILERELLYIQRYLSSGICDEVLIFSYDKMDHVILADAVRSEPALAMITLLSPPGNSIFSGKLAYSVFGPVLHIRALLKASVYKTNQLSGSWSALVSKLLTGRRLVVRLGYILSRRHIMNGKRFAGYISKLLEWTVFQASDAVVVTSAAAETYVTKVLGSGSKINLIPTYVDTALFRRRDPYQFSSPLLYVGRLTPQKNLVALIKAAARTGFALHLVGEGESRKELEAVATDSGAQVEFFGSRDNHEVADMMGRYTYFVLPSLHEGLPKVLIESMCAGMICIGTDIPGTNDLITDPINGYLADGVNVDAIARAIERAGTDRDATIGAKARELIVTRSGVETYIEREKIVLFPEFGQ